MPPPLHTLQPSFTAGELAPSLLGRSDFAKYGSALKTARNGTVHPEGGFSNRSGFKYVAAAKFSNKKCRLIPFEFSATQTYMIEFGDLYCRFYTNDGQIMSLGSPYEIATPYLEAEIPYLKVEQSFNTLYIASAFHAPATLVRVTDANWVLSNFAFINGPFNSLNPNLGTYITWDGTQLTSNSSIFQAGHVGALFKVFRSESSTALRTTLFDGESTTEIWAYRTATILTAGTWAGTINVFVGGRVISTLISANDANYNQVLDLSLWDYPVKVQALFVGPANHVDVTMSSGGFTFPSIYKVTAFVSSTVVNATLTDPPIDNSNLATWLWQEGSWSVVQGWPSVVAFYQDRLGWASSANNPVTVWLSQVGDYVNYGISDPLVDSDAISVNLNTRKLNTVQNLLSMSKLLPITLSGENSIGPGATGIFSPTSLDQKPQGARGSSYVPAIVVGNTGLYMQPMGTIMRSIGYQLISDTFTGDDLSLLSNHLFRNYTILALAYQQEPGSVVWAVRNDGLLLSMTYMPEQQVVGWTWHDTQGTFESVATIPNSTLGINEVWVVVNRPNGRFIERMAKRLPTLNVQDQVHLDCSISYSGAPATVISGLTHLNGMSVMALADGSVQGPFTVSGGAITLDVAASVVHVGLAYTTDFETLYFNGQMQDGSTQGRRQRAVQATVRFLNSVGGYLGFDSTHMHAIPQRTTQPLGSPIPLLTYDHRQPLTSSWQNQGRVFYRQTDPLPVTILAVIPNTELGDL